MNPDRTGLLPLLVLALLVSALAAGDSESPGDAAALRRAVTFYASFDESIEGSYGKGSLSPRTLSRTFSF